MRTTRRTRTARPSAPRVRPVERLTVTLAADGILVYRSIQNGICGPAECSKQVPADLAAADAWLAEFEYRRTGEWRTNVAYDGLRLEADLERVERPIKIIECLEWNA